MASLKTPATNAERRTMNAVEERGGYRAPGAGYGLRAAASRILRSVALACAVSLAACATAASGTPAQSPPPVAQRARAVAGRRRDEGRSTSCEPAARGTTSLGQMECRPSARRAPWWAHPREARRPHRRAVAGAFAPRIDLRSVDVPRRRDRRARRHAALDENATRVQAWIGRRTSKPNLAIRYRARDGLPIGRVLDRGDTASHDARGAVVVLRWRDDGWYVLTSYPEDVR